LSTGYITAPNMVDKGLAFFTPEDLETWDWEFTSIFNLTDNTDGQYVQDYQKPWYAYFSDPDWLGYAAEGTEYYNYVTAGWVQDVNYPEFWHVNLGLYYFQRFRGGKIILEREYPSVFCSDGSTTKTDHLSILRKMTLDMGDGEGDKNFFIIELHKDLAANKAFVRLHEI